MMEYLKYKGYVGSIHYSHEDKVFWGKLEVEGLITFEAETAVDFEMSFQNAVDEYLKDCRRLGIEPRKTALKTDDSEEIFIQRADVELFELV